MKFEIRDPAPTRVVRPLLIGLTLLAMFVLSAVPAYAATTIYKSQEKGDTVLYASSYTGDDCNYLEQFVTVVGSKTEPARIEFVLYGSNWCTGETYFQSGHGSVSTFDVSNRLDEAHVEAVVPWFDHQTGETLGDRSIDLTWTATTPVSKTITKERTSVNGVYRSTLRITGMTAGASVTGTINSPAEGYMSKESTFNHVIYHYPLEPEE